MPLTAEGQDRAARLLPRVLALGFTFDHNDDEAQSYGMELLCRILSRKPDKPDEYIMTAVRNRLRQWWNRRRYERKKGLAAGSWDPPDTAQKLSDGFWERVEALSEIDKLLVRMTVDGIGIREVAGALCLQVPAAKARLKAVMAELESE